MDWPTVIRFLGKMALVMSAAVSLAGCGGHLGNFDVPEASGSKLGALLGFKNNDAPAAEGTQVRHIFCPEIIILEGTAASQVHAGTPPSSANLKYQFGLTDAARECSLEGDQLAIKIGVAGRVLLGPAGTAGTYTVPVRMAIVREQGNEPLVSKLYRASVSVGMTTADGDFTIVSEPLHVPFTQDHAEEDYSIKVGIDEAASADKSAGKHSKP
ncbi:hypothetical protein CU048_00700 [Beijerinckiaceae bacterium]|nr:hypothetical protein CU048_00700 [Beijerinckiaceae bacterium]